MFRLDWAVMDAPKLILAQALTQALNDLAAKADGLSELDQRRPLTPTGTNLLGLMKHVASITLGYLGGAFGRDPGIELPWFAPDSEEDADFWVLPTESRRQILDLYAAAQEVAAATVAALDLDAPGVVPWWPPERRQVTLQQIMVHLIAEIARHAGHADIVRELIDGEVGRFPADPCVGHRTAADWVAHRARLEEAAHTATGPAA